MRISVHHQCRDFDSYRAARTKSLFNVESGCHFRIEADLPVEDTSWQLGVIVGPSGSGKSSFGKQFWDDVSICDLGAGWHDDRPIIDEIAKDDGFDAVTRALAAVGLGDVPAWLRPFRVLSGGEQFRAGLARIIAERPGRVIVDEFSSVIDRQLAKVGALAFAKSWRRGAGQCLLLSCHYDILPWIQPDWAFDTATGDFLPPGRWLQRPQIRLDIHKTNWRYWRYFEPHHYLKLPNMIAAKCYVGTIDGQLVAHAGLSQKCKGRGVIEARVARLVVMPEWQGIGVGTRFLEQIAEWNLQGSRMARHPGRPMTTIINTSHPGLAAALRRNRKWRQTSASLYGSNKAKSAKTITKANGLVKGTTSTGYGGHFRATQGFRYVGQAGLAEQ